jgi:hypothetical protein
MDAKFAHSRHAVLACENDKRAVVSLMHFYYADLFWLPCLHELAYRSAVDLSVDPAVKRKLCDWNRPNPSLCRLTAFHLMLPSCLFSVCV